MPPPSPSQPHEPVSSPHTPPAAEWLHPETCSCHPHPPLGTLPTPLHLYSELWPFQASTLHFVPSWVPAPTAPLPLPAHFLLAHQLSHDSSVNPASGLWVLRPLWCFDPAVLGMTPLGPPGYTEPCLPPSTLCSKSQPGVSSTPHPLFPLPIPSQGLQILSPFLEPGAPFHSQPL